MAVRPDPTNKPASMPQARPVTPPPAGQKLLTEEERKKFIYFLFITKR